MDVEFSAGTGAGGQSAETGVKRAPGAKLLRARDWHAAGRLDEAEREYEAVLAQTPHDAQAIHLYGVLRYQKGSFEEAQSLLRRAMQLAPSARMHSDLGAMLADHGRANEALEHFDAALRLDETDVQTLVRQGNTLLGLKQYARALTSFDRALAVSPLVLDALCNRGSALRALGRHREALDTYDRALVVDPRSFESWFNRGLVLRELEQSAPALESFDRAIAIRPGNAAMHSARGQALLELGRETEALAAFNEAIAIDPAFVEAVYNSAVVLERLGRNEEAMARCDRVLSIDPRHARALACRGNTLLHLKRYDAAIASYDQALTIDPKSAEVLCNKGTALRYLKRFDDSLANYDAALALNEAFAQAWMNRGSVLQNLHRYDEARVSFDRAMQLRPDHATTWFNRGNLDYEMGDHDGALSAYDRAIAIDPEYAEAHFARASLYLAQGDFERGWPEYEWRLKDATLARHYRAFTRPLWRGDEPLAGKTILLHAEQGFGDTLQFCRFAHDVAALGARVVLEVPPALHELMTSLDVPAQVIMRGDPLPPFDYHCPLLSLPFALRVDPLRMAARTPYLHADPQRVEAWSQVLGERRRLRIGIAWSGNPEHRNDHNRSLSLQALSALFDVDAEWISLQKGVREDDEAWLDRVPLKRFDDDFADFADTAALMASLDLVIAVDTSVAHLAGALGREVWILLSNPPEWRWMRGREDTPWYPGARLFVQPAPGDWTRVIEAVKQALGRLNA
ncbi:tetratricopeptide repeat protein [Trinickia diaoshuihuensis]|uniref:tetratricopeptide repeat protein n=1 Tax=Trinickia diaoshuihuensis TaxID=2292265 RepID=UPI000E27C0DE|nr:tetratricopeptide repeat protein [Trinickia diaoshuihuensis]